MHVYIEMHADAGGGDDDAGAGGHCQAARASDRVMGRQDGASPNAPEACPQLQDVSYKSSAEA
jgi:hypothetical protein